MIHSGEKSFKCLVCDKGIDRRGYLKMQMRTHTGEKHLSVKCVIHCSITDEI